MYYDRTVSGTLPPPPSQQPPPSQARPDASALGPTGTIRPPANRDDGTAHVTPDAPTPQAVPAMYASAMPAQTTSAIPVFDSAPSRPVPSAASVAVIAPPHVTNVAVPGKAPGLPVDPGATTATAARHDPSPRSVPQPPVSSPTAVAAAVVSAPSWNNIPKGAFRVESSRGEYLVGREVGAGHFGSVFECFGPFDQRYALKVLRPTGRAIDRVREEWTREVRRLLALRHPNVVYIHDAFEWQGAFCVALEWCDHTLREMLEQPLREELAIELSRQMLAAVQYLHDSDLVHDDLHPRNVLIQQADRPIVKISDFGISTELRGATAARPEVVHHAIMAPELLAVGYTSKQSDLYQLGLIMYWMVVGQPPMDMNVPYQALVQQIADGVARQRAEALGTPFGAIVAKLLRRRDLYRYTSAREVWNDLKQLPAWQRRALFPVR